MVTGSHPVNNQPSATVGAADGKQFIEESGHDAVPSTTGDAPSMVRPANRTSTISFGRSAAIVGAAFIVSRVLGLVREVIFAHRFGTSAELDAYISAFRIPDLLFLVVMSGAFGSAFIPVFGGFLARGEREHAWRLASAVITLTATVAIVLGAVILVFADPIMRYVVAPDLSPEAHRLATQMMRLLLLSPILLGLGIAAKGILEAQDLFTLPALAPVLYNIAIILAALLLAPRWGIQGVAIGVIVGAALHVAVQVPGLVRTGLRFRPTWSRATPGLATVARLLAPRVVGQAAFQINFIAVNHFAAALGEGRVSGLNYAWQIMMLPHGVLALSISTVVFPTMARAYEHGDLDTVSATFAKALTPLLFLILPASVGLFELRTAIIQSVFQTGAFGVTSTSLVTEPLAFLALGLSAYAVVEVLARTFYALQDTKTPVITGIAIIIVNIALGAILSPRIGHAGLAIALSVSTGIEAVALFALLRKQIDGLGAEFAWWFARVALATAVMAMVVDAMRPRLEAATAPGAGPRLMQLGLLALAVLTAAWAYALAAKLLRIPEIDVFLGRLTSFLPERLASWM
jgi:putative peptidoglycan lipid II flippase